MTIREIMAALELQKVDSQGQPVVIVPTVKATVEQVYQVKRGQGQYGNWSLQTIVVTDGTDRISVSLRNRDEESNALIGTEVTMSSVTTSKGQNGVRCEEREFIDSTGQKRIVCELVVTKSAIMDKGEKKEKLVARQAQEEMVNASALLRTKLVEACTMLLDEELVGLKNTVTELGWNTEDIRALGVSLFIESRRGNR